MRLDRPGPLMEDHGEKLLLPLCVLCALCGSSLGWGEAPLGFWRGCVANHVLDATE